MKMLVPLCLTALLGACGVADTGGAAATAAAAKVKEAEQAKAVEAQVRQQLDEAARLQAERLKQADGG